MDIHKLLGLLCQKDWVANLGKSLLDKYRLL